MQVPHQTQDCRVKVEGISVLELRVSSQKDHRSAVAVWVDPALSAAEKSTPDRKAAEWVLSVGDGMHTSITVRENGEARVTRELPAGPFELTGVTLQHNQKITDEDMARLKDCKNLTLLHLGYTRIGDAGLVHFKGCTKLTTLFLSGGLGTTDLGLSYFKDCRIWPWYPCTASR